MKNFCLVMLVITLTTGAFTACDGSSNTTDVFNDAKIDANSDANEDAAENLDVESLVDLAIQNDAVADAPGDLPASLDAVDDATANPDLLQIPDAPIDDVQPDPGQPVCVEAGVAPTYPYTADTAFLRGPYLQQVLQDKATVVWRAQPEVTGTGCVTAVIDGVERTECVQPDANNQYSVTFDGLTPDAEIHYRAYVGATTTTEDLVMHTAPADNLAVRFLVFADGHRNALTLDLVGSVALGHGVDFGVSVGDQVNQPEEEQYDDFFNGMRAFGHRLNLWPVLGNHDARGKAYFDAFDVPGEAPDEGMPELYYQVRIGNVWMAMLEIIDWSIAWSFGVDDYAQIDWLEAALDSESAQSATWRIVFIHQPPWCVGWGGCDDPQYHGEAALRDILVPLAAEKGVTAIFSGHMHGWEHGVMDGVHLIVTGGAGGGLDHACDSPEVLPDPWTTMYEFHSTFVDARCDGMTIQARTLEDVVIDTIEIPAP